MSAVARRGDIIRQPQTNKKKVEVFLFIMGTTTTTNELLLAFRLASFEPGPFLSSLTKSTVRYIRFVKRPMEKRSFSPLSQPLPLSHLAELVCSFRACRFSHVS